MFNHSLVKSLLFMAAGNIAKPILLAGLSGSAGVMATSPVLGKVFLLAFITESIDGFAAV